MRDEAFCCNNDLMIVNRAHAVIAKREIPPDEYYGYI